ncbi:MAG: calcium/sodium antiporter [Lachnospiraceae bacterium]|nr:calcium/sodium antiporter [Lachnospiraceae bacterium]
MGFVMQLILLVIGFVMLIKGADLFVEGAASIAERFGIPQLVVGLTIVAMGTSAPEAAVSIASALKGSADITVGNVVGSNVLNVLVILGLTAVITMVPVGITTVKYEIPYMILITVLFLGMGITGNKITLVEGVFLWIAFIAYLVYLLFQAKKNKDETQEENKKPMWLLFLLTVGGLALVVWGSDVTVDAASNIAKAMGMSERFIGLTIVALGTSLPELCTSVSAATKGKADIAIGNIVGSNVFNILFVVGTTALITPVAFAQNFVVDTTVAILSGVLLWVAVVLQKGLKRMAGVIMLVAYAGYFVYLIQ